MKKAYIILVAFFTFTTIGIVSCSNAKKEKSNETRTAGVTYKLDDASHKFSLTITFYNDGTNSLSSSEKTSIGAYLNSRFSAQNFSSVSRIDAIFGYDANDVHKEEVALLGFGLDSENIENPIAIVFNGDGDGTGGTLALD